VVVTRLWLKTSSQETRTKKIKQDWYTENKIMLFEQF